MAIVVSLINMKGGVGKSTLSVNLAWHYAAYSDGLKKVLVVDLDPQFNASQYLVGVTKYQEHLTEGDEIFSHNGLLYCFFFVVKKQKYIIYCHQKTRS